MNRSWTHPLRLGELGRDPVTVRLGPDAEQRAAIAKQLGLEALPALSAHLTLRPWMDGVEIGGRFEAVVEQVCAVSLDTFEQPLGGEIGVRAVPSDSLHAADPGGEVAYDPEAPDPPDVLDTDAVDLAAYVVEHLALAIDPFARKPGATFDYTPPEGPPSPFAALAKLKGEGP